MEFTDEQIQRYSRHLILDHVGVEGQEKISEAKVLVIGAGGLGSPVLLYLAAAGVGTIGIVDSDVVDLTNLQRQVIHFTDDVDLPKVTSAEEKINKINPDIRVITHHEFVNSKNIAGIIENYDFIVDGTDNFPVKFLINDACVLAKKPFSHAGILRFDGQIMTVVPGESACYRCVFPEPPPPDLVPTCSQAGVLGALAGIFGTLQASEVLKYIIGIGDLLTNRLLICNALKMSFREVKLKKRAKCPICGENPSITTLIDYDQAICDLKQ
ncbi:MAG: molybdopterin-synthase adenylyltransferase MoeB [Deltaproteobacteria bacterium]|nr:molybdopterin-synthase adenylyltransferase MoeB [Deltaproteobacteria bacterium]